MSYQSSLHGTSYLPTPKEEKNSDQAGKTPLHQGERNMYLAIENELFAVDPALAAELRARATPAITKQLKDIENSAKALEESIRELEDSRREYLKKAKQAAQENRNDDAVMIRLNKLEDMIARSQKSLELNRSTRNDLVEWMLGRSIPSITT